MRSFVTNGKAVSAYTGSPSRAFLVEIACLSVSGPFVPAGITMACGSLAAGACSAVIAGACACGPVAAVALADSAACPQAIPEMINIAKIARMSYLQSDLTVFLHL